MVVLSVCLLAFLGRPLSTGGYYAATDLLQVFLPFHISPPDYRAKNGLLGDTVLVYHPYLQWNRSQLQAGRLPLWNPYNAAGAPHLASLQSAVFSPFSLPYYVFDFRVALLVSAFLRLFTLGFFTYLFLRSVSLGHGPGLFGAVAFTFAGYNVLWLNFSLPSSGLVIPAGLYAAELALQARPSQPTRHAMALLGLTLTVAVSILAGHPETFFCGALLVAAYISFRLWHLKEDWRRRGRRLTEIVIASVLGVALTAIQLLPFLEYLSHSVRFHTAGKVSTKGIARALTLWPLQAFPDLLGSPALPFYELRSVAAAGYIATLGTYVGLIVIFLAGLGVFASIARRSLLGWFFVGVVVVWLAIYHNVLSLWTALAHLPIVGLLKPTRSSQVLVFTLSVLAAVGVDAVLSRANSRRLAAVTWAMAAWAIALLAVPLWGALLLWRRLVTQAPDVVANSTVQRIVASEVLWLTTLLALAIGCALWLARTPSTSESAHRLLLPELALVVLVFGQTGWLQRDFNPSIDPRYFYPLTPALKEIRAHAGEERMLTLGNSWIPPNVNMWYGLRNVELYDGIQIGTYEALKNDLLATKTFAPIAAPASARALQVMGIQYVLTASDSPLSTSAAGAPLTEPNQLKAERASDSPVATKVWAGHGMNLFRISNSLPRYYTVSCVKTVAGDKEALGLLRHPVLDLHTTVVLDRAITQATDGCMGEPASVRVQEERPGFVRLRVDRGTAGWLVVLQSFYPGWNATVNGRPATLVRANVAFTAVPVGPGANEVVLQYDPLSIKIGLAITTAAGLLVVLLPALLLGRDCLSRSVGKRVA